MTEGAAESDVDRGHLGTLCASQRDVQQTRLALAQRGMTRPSEAMKKVEDSLGREIDKEMRAHPLWPWLEQFPGLRGVHTARLMSVIRDPRRFPGQGCTKGHAFVPDYVVGGQCPIETWPDKERCTGLIVERLGTGVRALWRYSGMDVVDGHAPRKKKGTKAHWSPIARAALMQPGGIAEQIVRQRVPVYRDIYDAAKARLTEERGAGQRHEADRVGGAAILAPHEAEAVRCAEIVGPSGLRPIQIEKIARTIAAKAFAGDLLIAWKARVVSDRVFVRERGEGLP